jgi:hypothetical protein
MKPFGVYSVPISGLQELTKYTWSIQVTDGKDTTEETFTFTTEPIAPVVSNIVPADGAQDVPIGTSQLRFTLNDYQGDAMEYTVETSPNIGAAHEVGVHDGTYTVPIHGLSNGTAYRWYVNVTDGQHWARKVSHFETAYPPEFDPFDYGWQYRKQITINHTQIVKDLVNFPLLINVQDADLNKAQQSGNDILFMNRTGIASKLFHEIETFDVTLGTLIVWVNVPSVSSIADTIIYIYYGNAQCGNQQRPRKTWNSDYISVWHLNQNSGPVYDSIGQHDGTASSGVTEGLPGIIDRAFGFDGSAGYIDFGDINRNLYAVSFWVKPIDTISPTTPLTGILDLGTTSITHYGASFGIACDTIVDETITIWSGIPEYRTAVTDLIITNSIFHLITFNWNATANRYDIYFDGIQYAVVYGSEGHIPLIYVTNFGIGHEYAGGHGKFYNGIVDEVRLLGTSLNSGWISTEYNNQLNPSDFISVGPEEQGP